LQTNPLCLLRNFKSFIGLIHIAEGLVK